MTFLRKLSNIARYGFPKRRPHRPLLVIFHITTRCNMACRHCGDDVWGDPKNDLSLEDIRKFTSELGTIDSLALGGGEPFLRQDLAEICRLFVTNSRVAAISIPSNGFAPDKICTSVRSILDACPQVKLNIMLSLDGFQETHDAIRTGGSFSKVMETARLLTPLANAIPHLSLSFNTTIHNNNWQELPALAQFVNKEFNARLEFNIIAGNPRDPSYAVPQPHELQKTLDALFSCSRTTQLKRLYNRTYRDILLQTNAGRRQAIPCRAGSLVCLIDANGDVRACPVLPPLGSIKTHSFDEIWHSPEAKSLFHRIVSGGCACNNDCFVRLSLMNYWKLPFLMVKRLFIP